MSDLIDRRVVIHAMLAYMAPIELGNGVAKVRMLDSDAVIKIVTAIPSAQPETTERTAEEAQNVSDSDLISRKAAIDAIRASTSKYTGFMEMEMYTDDDAVEAIKALPSAQPEWKTGKWKKISPASIYECSVCGQNIMTQDIDAYRYCHGCGADMGVSE